jgi:hypothetical protein
LKRVLFDSDVLLDVLAQRQPFVLSSARALNTVTQEQVQGYVSDHAVTNIFYILRRQIGSEAVFCPKGQAPPMILLRMLQDMSYPDLLSR